MSWCRNMICGNLAQKGQEYCDTCQSMRRKAMGETEPCRRAYSREEIINEAKTYIREEYGPIEDRDRKYQMLGVLVDFLHDRFPPDSGEGVSE